LMDSVHTAYINAGVAASEGVAVNRKGLRPFQTPPSRGRSSLWHPTRFYFFKFF